MLKANPVPEAQIWNKTFFLILVVSFCMFLSMYMLLPTLPLYAQTLGGNETVAGTIVALFTLSAVLVRPWFGNLLDRKGRKAILIIGVGIFLVSALAYHLTFSIITLLALRVVHGVGWSASTTATGTMASDVIPASRRAEGMGYYGIAATIAMSLGPALGLYLVKYSSYSVLFTGSAILAALGLAGSFFINYEAPRKNQAKAPLVKGVILEKTALPPALVLFFITLTYGGIISFLPSYANYRGVENIGMFFTVYALVLLFGRPIIGKMADRYGARKFLVPGILLIAIALLLLVTATSMPMFLLVGVVYGLGFGTVHPILNALVISLSPPERRGAANATFAMAMDLGIGLGAVTLGFLAQKMGYVYMYGSSAIFTLLALVMYYTLLRKKLPH
ncbi:MFS transporter [Desulfosporosinus sp. BICA1-9]|uniref:MFS transporter n=1 Tax=Desulfosporosinus sp. BICA1-9 TaxID=1531958 RepID=UPI00054B2A11|nr:MFS transporter [Desulfosporosinus sp. BICA1-9]KJS48964.1 MAG: arabinose ABC transporter permease [Peptococcaceae bacterium BRH_c23]KJS84044.1 MAG: arabinose ABC transporter permease [Desulfosporosinus sp. BICA1-9]HBW33893.1 MFS transporter [Desulfosporosinus sp.]